MNDHIQYHERFLREQDPSAQPRFQGLLVFQDGGSAAILKNEKTLGTRLPSAFHKMGMKYVFPIFISTLLRVVKS